MDPEKPEFVHYKNGIFHGYTKNGRPAGECLCLYDNGAILIGNYLAAHPFGKCCIMLWPDTYFIGTLKKGMLDGSFAIRSPQFQIYSQTSMNKIEGEVVVIDRKNKRARVWQIERTCIREGQYEELLSEEKILRAVSPYTETFPSLFEYFQQIASPNNFAIRINKTKDKLQITLKDKIIRKVALQFQKQRIVAAGIMEEGQIAGFGYLYDRMNSLQLEGEIYKGLLDGEGVKRQLTTGKVIFGKFTKGDIRSLDVVDFKSQNIESNLIKLKKKIHLHSLEFTNDYLNERPIYLLRNFYQTMVQNEQQYNNYIKSTKGAKPSTGVRRNSLQTNKYKQPNSDELTYNINQYNLIKNALSNQP